VKEGLTARRVDRGILFWALAAGNSAWWRAGHLSVLKEGIVHRDEGTSGYTVRQLANNTMEVSVSMYSPDIYGASWRRGGAHQHTARAGTPPAPRAPRPRPIRPPRPALSPTTTTPHETPDPGPHRSCAPLHARPLWCSRQLHKSPRAPGPAPPRTGRGRAEGRGRGEREGETGGGVTCDVWLREVLVAVVRLQLLLLLLLLLLNEI
jgi:hypothetical protein